MEAHMRKLQEEVYIVSITRNVQTGIALGETWRNDKGQIQRPRQDGPAIITRDSRTGVVKTEADIVDGQTVAYRDRFYNARMHAPNSHPVRPSTRSRPAAVVKPR
jgi:hypothetical protein